jgi:cyanuric acid amidohydrolase
MVRCELHCLPTDGPGDVAALEALIATGVLHPAHIVAVLGKTEGNGCVNDYTREYATVALTGLLARHLGVPADVVRGRIAFVMSGGTEGVLAPHLSVFTRQPAAPVAPSGAKRLSVGIAATRDFLPEEIGTLAQVHATAQAVRAAMADAGIADVADVHFVQVKCPLLSAARIAEAAARGTATATRDTYESMALSRGASSLGVALATGEVAEAALRDGAVLRDEALWSSVASASAGIELQHNVALVIGMSAAATGPFVVAHDVMRDAIDAGAVRRALERTGAAPEDVVNVFAKAEASPDGRVRGWRHTMLNDSDIHATRHARAAVGGVIASVVGRPAIYVSGGAEHQGPPGGGPVAVVARCRDTA